MNFVIDLESKNEESEEISSVEGEILICKTIGCQEKQCCERHGCVELLYHGDEKPFDLEHSLKKYTSQIERKAYYVLGVVDAQNRYNQRYEDDQSEDVWQVGKIWRLILKFGR